MHQKALHGAYINQAMPAFDVPPGPAKDSVGASSAAAPVGERRSGGNGRRSKAAEVPKAAPPASPQLQGQAGTGGARAADESGISAGGAGGASSSSSRGRQEVQQEAPGDSTLDEMTGALLLQVPVFVCWRACSVTLPHAPCSLSGTVWPQSSSIQHPASTH
jgi:hypothetical protein